MTATVPRWVRPANFAVRGATLFLRFALLFYIVREIGLAEAGIYGVGQALIAAAPAVLGFSLNYHLPRILNIISPGEARGIIRARLLLSTAVGLLVLVVGVGSALAFAEEPHRLSWALIAVLCALELVGNDLATGLVSLRRSTAANVVAFLRSAAWVPLIWLLLAFSWRLDLGAVLAIWCGFSLITVVVAALLLARGAGSHPVGASLSVIVKRARATPYVYVNEFANAAFAGADRYVAGAFVALELVGAYSFYASFGTAAYVLVFASVVEVAIPDIITHARQGGRQWAVFSAQLIRRSLTWIAMIGIGTAGAAIAGAIATGSPTVLEYAWLAAFVLVYQVINMFSVTCNMLLFGLEQDKFMAASNLAALVVSVPLYAALAYIFGLEGLCAGVLISAIALAVAKYVRLRQLEGVPGT